VKKCYIPKAFSAKSKEMIDSANEIIEEYQAKGFVLTLRQLYYQFVSRDLLANKQTEYKRLGSIINDARLAGLIDWEAMEDRTRNLVAPATWGSPAEIIRACASQFSTDWWARQAYYVEAWIEKDALLGVLEFACLPWQLPYFSCRGYTSASEVWEAAQRIGRRIKNEKRAIILHLGDHDPSGCDMSRDITDRMRLFLEGDGHDPDSLDVRRIALNMDQIRQYNPPPNPAKFTDSRCAAYVERHGDESWELDALSPEVLSDLIAANVEEVIEEIAWSDAKDEQEAGREQLRAVSANWNDVVEFVEDCE
jgi:hypothetical protein